MMSVFSKFGPFPGHGGEPSRTCQNCGAAVGYGNPLCSTCSRQAWDEMIAENERDRAAQIEARAAQERAAELAKMREFHDPVRKAEDVAYWAERMRARHAFPMPGFPLDSDCYLCCAIIDEHGMTGTSYLRLQRDVRCPRHTRTTDDMKMGGAA